MRRIVECVVLLLLVLLPCCAAGTHYVDPFTGSDRTCDPSCASIAGALTRAVTDDVIILLPGTHHLSESIDLKISINITSNDGPQSTILSCNQDVATAFNIVDAINVLIQNITVSKCRRAIQAETQFTLNNVVFSDCNATNTSLILVTSDVNPFIENCLFQNIKGPIFDGYAVTISQSTFKNSFNDFSIFLSKKSNHTTYISDSVFDTIEGGGVAVLQENAVFVNNSIFSNIFGLHTVFYAEGNSNINLDSCVFDNNYVSNDAPVGFFNESHGTFTNCTVYNGRGDRSGALFVYRGELILKNSKFYNNTAAQVGGLLYAIQATVSIIESEIHSHSAGQGGAIFVDQTNISILSSKIHNNYASQRGGVVAALRSSLVYFSNCEIHDNVCDNLGGVGWATALEVDNSTVYNNRASHSGGFYVVNNATITNTHFYNNNAYSGSNLELDASAELTNVTFWDCGVNFKSVAVRNMMTSSNVIFMKYDGSDVSKINLVTANITACDLPSLACFGTDLPTVSTCVCGNNDDDNATTCNYNANNNSVSLCVEKGVALDVPLSCPSVVVTDVIGNHLPPSVGGNITVIGTNFVSSTRILLYSDHERRFTQWVINSTMIIVQLGRYTGILKVFVSPANYSQVVDTSFTVSYLVPDIYFVSPNSISPNVPTVLSISGHYFGQIQSHISVNIGPNNQNCDVLSFSDSSIACIFIPNVGLHTTLHVTATIGPTGFSQQTNSYNITAISGCGLCAPEVECILNEDGSVKCGPCPQYYVGAGCSGPSVADISPTILSTAGGVITVYGYNFGVDASVISVEVGTRPCTGVSLLTTFSTSGWASLVCAVGAGTGKNKSVVVTVDGVWSVDRNRLLSRYAPIVTGYETSVQDMKITIYGENFGPNTNTVRCLVCNHSWRVLSTNDSMIVCEVPSLFNTTRFTPCEGITGAVLVENQAAVVDIDLSVFPGYDPGTTSTTGGRVPPTTTSSSSTSQTSDVAPGAIAAAVIVPIVVVIGVIVGIVLWRRSRNTRANKAYRMKDEVELH